MIFIKFILTNGDITVDEAQAKAILKSEQQLIPIRDESGGWTYETLNKAFIVRTVMDKEAMRTYNLKKQAEKAIAESEEEKKRLLAMSPEERAKLEQEEKERKEKITLMFADLKRGMEIPSNART